jgi:hypothetical protein
MLYKCTFNSDWSSAQLFVTQYSSSYLRAESRFIYCSSYSALENLWVLNNHFFLVSDVWRKRCSEFCWAKVFYVGWMNSDLNYLTVKLIWPYRKVKWTSEKLPCFTRRYWCNLFMFTPHPAGRWHSLSTGRPSPKIGHPFNRNLAIFSRRE